MDTVFEIFAVGLSATLFFGVIFGFIAFMRWLRYKETTELARQGMLPARQQARSSRRSSRLRRFGVMVTAIGGAMTLGLFTIGFDPYTPLLGPWLLGGLIPLSIGIGMLYLSSDSSVGNSAENTQDDDPIPPHKVP